MDIIARIIHGTPEDIQHTAVYMPSLESDEPLIHLLRILPNKVFGVAVSQSDKVLGYLLADAGYGLEGFAGSLISH